MGNLLKRIVLLGVVVLLTFTTACGNRTLKTTEVNEVNTTAEVSIRGLEDGEKVISLDRIKELETVTQEMESITSSGEVKRTKVKGVPLESLLGLYDTSQKNYGGIRFIAGDSYSIVVPEEVLQKRKIVLAYEVDDKALKENALPLMLAVPHERSMYWVKNLVEIELLKEEESSKSKVVFIETAATQLKQEDYTYYESLDKAIKVVDLFSKFNESHDKKSIYFKAVDGFEKDEDIEVLKTGYIKITGKNTPLFLSPELPKGMHVKNILYFTYGDTTYFSLNSSLNSFEKKTLEGNEGISLKEIFKEAGLTNGEKYLFTASDGYEIEISADDIGKGLIYMGKDNGFNTMFEGMPKNTKIKGILKIEAVK